MNLYRKFVSIGVFSHFKEDFPQCLAKDTMKEGSRNAHESDNSDLQPMNTSVQEKVKKERFEEWIVVDCRK